jgi:hypothetical protein
MERVLLVEPNYLNKYPPMGLMKIATFHRMRGDIAEFYKGEAPYTKIVQADRIYITSLFTFHYDITVKCIQHYLKYINKDCVYFGGIAATLLASEFSKDTSINNIVCGLLTDSRVLGYDERINIDMLPLDYDILDDVSYTYPMGDSYFIHTTRGCPRACPFCAVKTLEPKFETTNNVIGQVRRVDDVYGKKRNLLVMDNNILCSPKLDEIISDIRSLGFTGDADYINPNPFLLMMAKIRRRIQYNISITSRINETILYLQSFGTRLKRYPKVSAHYCETVSIVAQSEDIWDALQMHEEEINHYIEKYRAKTRMIRYVDFNQGIDARLISEENIRTLSSIPIRPFRLAYDSIGETDTFFASTKMAMAHGIKEFSNYILYNWEDEPKDLWIRLNNAISLYNNKEYSDNRIIGFSFPMKYAPVNEKDRSFIGKYWNKKYLGAVNIILNVTKGVVAKEQDFFFEAFGSSINEFFEILIMPDELIRFRHFFRDNGLLDFWRGLYAGLSEAERQDLLDILCAAKMNRGILNNNYPLQLRKIIELYKINKSQFDRGEKNTDVIIQKTTEMQ